VQALLASLVVGMSVKDESFRAAMATNRAEVKKTGQEFDRSADQMGSAIERGARAVNAAAIRIVDSVASIGREVTNQGLKLTAGLTAPLGLLAHTANGTASDFQAAMNNVHAAMVGVDPAQLEKLREAALKLGPAMGKSAIEAATAIESLAKNGLSAADILSGGLENALKLGVLGQTDLGKAADATTDILQQFHLTTGALPGVVNKVSGALDASKLDFNGYADAIGMVGGIAGGLGYSFDDMNTALAAVIPLMTGGSDAGTSFKTFLLSLVPQSKDAADAMKKLGISFSNADGTMKTLGEAAEVLNTKLSGLNDRSRQEALTKIFGTDGVRVALALMQAGSKGIADVQAQIDKASANDKIAILLDGEAAATQRLSSAWEKLKIAIGEAGIIQFFTMLKEGSAAVLSGIAGMPPWFFKVAVAVGAFAAATGPLLLILTKLATIAIPLLALRLGPLALGFAAIINPTGVVIRLLGQLALQAGAATIIGRLGTAMVGVAGPIGLVVTALSILIPYYARAGEASDKAVAAGEVMAATNRAIVDTEMQLATAKGKARDAILQKAKADRAAARDALLAANADLIAARAAYARAKAAAPTAQGAAKTALAGSPFGGVAAAGSLALGATGFFGGQRAVSDAAANLRQNIDNVNAGIANLDRIKSLIDGAQTAGDSAKVDMSFDDPTKVRTKKGRDAEQDEARYEDALGQSRVERLQAQADLTGSLRARHKAETAALAEERASFIRQNANDDGLNDARRSQLLAAKDAALAVRQQVIDQTLATGLVQETYDLARARNEVEQENVRAAADMADSVGGRREAELRLLDLQRQQEEADLDLVLATKAMASVEWANASARKDDLDRIYGQRRAAVERQNEGPGGSYLRYLDRSATAIGEDLQDAGVSALKGLNGEITDAIMNTRNLGDAFVNMGKRIIASLIDIAVQQSLIRPLAEKLLGAGGSGGGFLSSLGKLVGLGGSAMAGSNLLTSGAGAGMSTSIGFSQIALPDFGGFRKNGGGINANDWYVVGEDGPEVFAPGVSGTVIPNSGLGDRSRERFEIVPSPWFDVRAASAARPETQSMGVRAAAGGARMAAADSAKRARRRLA
jgi:TP901 family phage tail tape measure protein